MRKRILPLILALIVALSMTVPACAAGNQLISPSPRLISPAAQSDVLTRGEFITALYKLETEDAGGTDQGGAASQDRPAAAQAFPDVPEDGELSEVLSWACGKGIVCGYGDGTFRPEAPVTREQMAAILYRTAVATDQAPEGEWMFPVGFADADEVSDFADEAIQWAVMNRILVGTGKGLEPKANATDRQLDIVLGRWETFKTPDGESRGIQILYTSDVHCGADKGFGSAGLAEVKNALTAQGYDVILVDDGDSISGEPLGTMTRGEAMIDLMNSLGYSVAIPGNHEFDFGVARFLELADKAVFPYVSCNFTSEGKRYFEPYLMIEAGGKKLAFAGVTTPQTITSSTPSFFQDADGNFIYGFSQDFSGQALYDVLQEAVDEALAEGADHVIVLAHLGNEDECVPWTYKDVISHTKGYEILLDGHSHDTDQDVVKNAAGEDVQRSACGTAMSCIGWCYISPEGELSSGIYSWDRGSSAPEILDIENKVSDAVRDAIAELDRKLAEVVAHTDEDLTISDPAAVDANGKPVRIVRSRETNLGDLCADAYRDQSGADIAFMNGGGVRKTIAAGDMTRRDIFDVNPFGNSLCVLEVSGQQILDALEWGAHALPGESGGFLQVSGISFEIHTYVGSPCVSDVNGMFDHIEGERRVKNVMVGDEPIDPERTYTLAGHDYMLLGEGDGYTMFKGAALIVDRARLDNQLLIDYIVDTLGGKVGEEYADPYGQGRIKIVTEK
jgi:2',3'-cyclic-nucleotide 2'-phosphodiesterase (5'-nucleotidase family)